MPYKDKKEQAEYLRKYRTPYMRGYQKSENERVRRLKQTVEKGDLKLAQTILRYNRTDIFSQTWKDLFPNSDKAKRTRRKG